MKRLEGIDGAEDIDDDIEAGSFLDSQLENKPRMKSAVDASGKLRDGISKGIQKTTDFIAQQTITERGTVEAFDTNKNNRVLHKKE